MSGVRQNCIEDYCGYNSVPCKLTIWRKIRKMCMIIAIFPFTICVASDDQGNQCDCLFTFSTIKILCFHWLPLDVTLTK